MAAKSGCIKVLYNFRARNGFSLLLILPDKCYQIASLNSSLFLRIKRNTCRVAPEVANLTRECSKQTQMINEDTEDYCNAWEESTELTRSGVQSINAKLVSEELIKIFRVIIEGLINFNRS